METKLYEVLDKNDTVVNTELGLLNEIVIGGLPLDIATSLAFESIFKAIYEPYDPARRIPNRITIADYPLFFINVKTLFRNVFSSMPPDQARLISPKQYVYFLNYEMNVIQSLLLNEGQNTSTPIFYNCQYEKLYKTKYPVGVRLRSPDTEKQKLYHDILTDVLALILKDKDMDVVNFKNAIDINRPVNALMLTHIPYDLFVYPQFKQLDLLESFTGVLKTRMVWPSKYYNGKDYLNVPFNSNLIKILGDHEMFHPMPMKYKNEVKLIAEKRNWNPLTTSSKVNSDVLKTSKDKDFTTLYNSLIKLA